LNLSSLPAIELDVCPACSGMDNGSGVMEFWRVGETIEIIPPRYYQNHYDL